MINAECDIAVEWTSPMDRVVDNYSCYKNEPGVKDCLSYALTPPAYKPLKQDRGREVGEVVGSRQLSAEQLTEARRAYRFDIGVQSVFVDLLNGVN